MKILVSEPLRVLTGGKQRIAGEGKTVMEVCANLTREYPGLLREVFRDDGRLQNGTTLFINGKDIRYIDGIETAVTEGDVLNLHAPMMVG
jgi:sulfur-carrier protein